MKRRWVEVRLRATNTCTTCSRHALTRKASRRGWNVAFAIRPCRKNDRIGKSISSYRVLKTRTHAAIAGTKMERNRGLVATAIAPGDWKKDWQRRADRFCRIYERKIGNCCSRGALSPRFSRASRSASTERGDYRPNASTYHDASICSLITRLNPV
jgi:hypothetical protein